MRRSNETDQLRFALPKGRVLKALVGLLRTAGMRFADDPLNTRKLTVQSLTPDDSSRLAGIQIELLLLKNADVPVYVEHGVAEVGVSGTDVLFESGCAVFRPYTFGFGGCDIVLAAREGQTLEDLRGKSTPHIATKYLRFAREHFRRLGWRVELIPLSGSVELAPVLGLAHAIVDLSETGNTLRENGLIRLDVIGKTELKLVVNRALTRSGAERVNRLQEALAAAERQQSVELK